MHKSEAKRLLEQDQPMRLAFNNWYHSKIDQVAWDVKNGKNYTPRIHFQAGFDSALEYRKINLEHEVTYDTMISAFQKWTEPYGKDWKPGIEESFATGWESGKKFCSKDVKKEPIKEQRNRLLKVTIRTAADVWTLKAEQDLRGEMIPNLRGEIIFKGDREEFGKFLMKLH